MKITDEILYVGVNDEKIDLFEGYYEVPEGMAYNSYLVKDEKITVFDSVEKNFADEWLANVKAALGDKTPDYLVVQHMEPDHSSSVGKFVEAFPEVTLVGNAKTFQFMKNFYGSTFTDRLLTVTDGQTLSTGKHEFKFIFAPMVHWPEVMVTFDSTDKVLFSADAFGKFGAIGKGDGDWACEARRYYFGIVGKYGMQVQTLLKKASALDIKTICPLHGPVLNENLPYYLNLYDIWSSYGTETEGVFIAYTSVYGNTKKAVEFLAEKLKEKGCPKVVVSDLARSDMAENVEDAFRYGKIVLATTTYNAEIFPFMKRFIDSLTERGWKNKTVGLIENGSWAPAAKKVMTALLANCKNITLLENSATLISSMNADTEKSLIAMAEELVK